MKSPKWTDSHRFSRPYVNAEESAKPGYLTERFATIRAEQEAAAASRATKLRSIGIRTGRKA